MSLSHASASHPATNPADDLFLRDALSGMAEWVGADRIAVYRAQPETREWSCGPSWTHPDFAAMRVESAPILLDPAKDLDLDSLLRGETVWKGNLGDAAPGGLSGRMRAEGALSFFAAPQIRDGARPAFVCTQWLRRAHEGGPEERRLLSLFAGLLLDALGRRDAEEALRFKNLAFDTAITGNLVAGRDGKATEANATFQRLWGYPDRREILGRPLPYFFREPGAAAPLIAALKRDGHWEGEFTAKRRDGGTFTASCLATVVRDETGADIGYQAWVVDITEREQARSEREGLRARLAQAERMESVGRLAGGIAHDFNNMLSVILGLTELELAAAAPGSPLRASLETIFKSARRSADLTHRLLAFARRQTVSPKVLDLNASVVGLLAMIRGLVGDGVSLHWRPEEGLWPVRMDPSQIDQILVNLCINARDAMGDLGELTLETANLRFEAPRLSAHDGAQAGDYVRLTVRDDGCGMDKAVLAQVFEPFFTTKPVGKGTGLGLSTVYGIVKQNNGFIDVHSERGRGATFDVHLPRCADAG